MSTTERPILNWVGNFMIKFAATLILVPMLFGFIILPTGLYQKLGMTEYEGLFMVFSVIAGMTIFYPACALLKLGDGPQAFFVGPWGRWFGLSVSLWGALSLLFWSEIILPYSGFDPDVEPKDVERLWNILMANIYFPIAALLISLFCFGIIYYYRSYYRRIGMLPRRS